jgi:hypothetical protein
MRDPILEELRHIRLQFLREMEEDMHRSAAKSNELLHKVCDVVVTATGERQYVLSPQKMYDELIAPRMAEDPAAVAAAKRQFGAR